MLAQVQKWGNSHGIRIPKTIMDILSLNTNDNVELTVDNDTIIIKKITKKKHRRLEDRLKDFNGEYKFEEADWGEPVGDEIW
ncbi:AbrB/MazE/SpoVT family DNA-binding domain-containing protein [bacterium]|nr:AbrB/MazE/SpoVT family DNA-binding domain-containing protein [bacterium]